MRRDLPQTSRTAHMEGTQNANATPVRAVSDSRSARTHAQNEPASRSLARAPVSPSRDLLTERNSGSPRLVPVHQQCPLQPAVWLSGFQVPTSRRPAPPSCFFPRLVVYAASHAYPASAPCACRDRIRPLERCACSGSKLLHARRVARRGARAAGVSSS